jgi:hypothetical protein
MAKKLSATVKASVMQLLLAKTTNTGQIPSIANVNEAVHAVIHLETFQQETPPNVPDPLKKPRRKRASKKPRTGVAI